MLISIPAGHTHVNHNNNNNYYVSNKIPFIQQVIIPHTAPKTPCRPRAPKSEFSREMALGTNESLYLLVLTAGNLKRDLEGNN